MASIYDKALKRKDFSGVVDKGVDEKNKGAAEQQSDLKANAGIGKIVNLMATDAGRIAMTVCSMYQIYGGKQHIQATKRRTRLLNPYSTRRNRRRKCLLVPVSYIFSSCRHAANYVQAPWMGCIHGLHSHLSQLALEQIARESCWEYQ